MGHTGKEDNECLLVLQEISSCDTLGECYMVLLYAAQVFFYILIGYSGKASDEGQATVLGYRLRLPAM